MADHKTLPVFAYASELPQLAEIRGYLNGLGASLDPNGKTDIVENLIEVSSNLRFLSKCTNAAEVDQVLTSVCSLIVTIGGNDVPEVVQTFSKSITPEFFKGTGWNSIAGNAARILSNLFHAFSNFPDTQEVIYRQLIEIAGASKLIGEVDCRVETLEEHFKRWNSSVDDKRIILRHIHAALLNNSRADHAAKVMLMLLGTYTDEDAIKARDDATECVRTAVVDPKSFSFDQLQRLSAVKALQKSDPLMHTALELFISGTLQDYKEFVAKHPEFISQKLRVDEPVLLKKIRLLTLMTIAESNNVISLEELAKKLELPNNEELEEFIIEALQTKAITGKMNEITRELHISSYQHRRFGKEQWISLQKRLETLIANLETTQKNIENINSSIDTHMGAMIA